MLKRAEGISLDKIKVPFSGLKLQYDGIKKEIDASIKEVIENSSFVLGVPVNDFEKNFARYCRTDYCAGVSNGTSALELCLRALGVKSGDEIITVPNTFIATTEAITATGARVKFVDVYEDTALMDVSALEKAVTKKTKVIIPVHLYGQMADMKLIKEIADKKDIFLIEDSAQAHGAEHFEKSPGYFSDAAAFSFYPGKNLGAFGDAGAVVTNNSEINEKICLLRNHGRKPGDKYIHSVEGFNHRLDSLQAAVLNAKLPYLDSWTEKKRKIAEEYTKRFGSFVACPVEKKYNKHVYHIYQIRLKERDNLKDFLAKQQVSTGTHYPIPLHLQPAYSHFGLRKGSYPVSEKLSEETLSLPIFPEMTAQQIDYVCDKVIHYQKKK